MNEFDDINFKGLTKPVKKHRVKVFFKAIGKKCWPHIKTGREVEDTAGKLNVEHYWNIAKGFFRNKAVAIMEGKNVSILGFGIPNLTWVIAGVGLIIALYFLIR